MLTAVVTTGAQINVVFVASSEEDEHAEGEVPAGGLTFAESQEF